MELVKQMKMINKTTALSLFASISLLFTGCASSESKSAQKTITLSGLTESSKEPIQNQTITITESELKSGDKPPSTFGEQPAETKAQGTGNTEIITSFDQHGNKIEKRFFNNDAAIRMIVKTTSNKGNVEVAVLAMDGKRKIASGDLSDQLMSVSGSEVARVMNISAPLRILPTTPSIAQGSTPKPLPAKIYPTVSPVASQPQPVDEQDTSTKPDIAKSNTGKEDQAPGADPGTNPDN